MKKSNLWAGMLFILGGVVCLAIALMLDTRLDSLLFGFAGGLIAPGAIMIIKYFYWTAPQNRSRYAERLDISIINIEAVLTDSCFFKNVKYNFTGNYRFIGEIYSGCLLRMIK